MKTRKKIIAAAVLLVGSVFIIILNLAVQKKTYQEYIFDKSDNIKLKDIETYNEWVDFNDENAKDYFNNEIVNKYTLKFFMYMDELFKESKDLDENLENARRYLDSVLSPRMADRMLELYRTYLNYQISLQARIKEWGMPATPAESLMNLQRLQNYRRVTFGMEDADTIFGAGVKAEEYSIRRGMILNDGNLYGDEKESKLYALDMKMWGDEADAMSAEVMPYTRYQEKLNLYKKDFSELRSEEERQAKVRQIRRQIFNPDQLTRIEDVERLVAYEKKIQEEYFARSRWIQDNNALDQEDKDKKTRELQNATFGNEADAFRRGQAIEKGLKQFIK